jgi:MgsA AAA+ ATPase C terminal
MRDALSEAKQRLAREIDSYLVPTTGLIAADPWVVSSLLQKSIRRGETQIAQDAAFTFTRLKGAAIWRRLMVIAFEDVGVANIDAITAVVAASSDVDLRKSCGGNGHIAIHLAGLLAAAPKDRSADYLVGAKDHPALANFARTIRDASVEDMLLAVRDEALSLPNKAMAALFAAVPQSGAVGDRAAVDRLLGTYRELGVPEDLLSATEIAAARTREPITVMVPLIWLATNQTAAKPEVRDCPVPALVRSGDVPLYALDMHTRGGREAIWRFAREHPAVRWCLIHYVPERCWRAVAYVAAFYVDAAPVARRLMWDQSEALEAFGIERDLLYAGMPAEGIEPLLDVMRANLDSLNELRRDVLARSQADLVAFEVRHD